MAETKKRDASKPWMPAEYTEAEVVAIQALADGTADSFQQKRALDWIIKKACAAEDLEWRPGGAEGDRDTSFASGKRFAGLQIIKLIKLNPELVRSEH